MIAAFDGWNDAGEAATMAVGHLSRVWDAEPFAEIDPEEFHDFTETRPSITLTDGLTRRIDWPGHTFSAAPRPDGRHDVVLLAGVEPELRWRTYCAGVVGVARELGCELVVTLGSLLADTPHTRPVRITGTVGTAALAAELGLSRSRYEGPTGIVGVLHDACLGAGMASASLWAAVPHYVGRSPSPTAALALVERTASLIGLPADTTPLRDEAVQYLAEIDEAVMDDDDASAYVRTLEEHADEGGEDIAPHGFDEPVSPHNLDQLTAEVERYLREHGGGR